MKGYVLENKLGISKSSELHIQEERITKLKVISLWENDILKDLDSLSLDTLSVIHKYMFDDVYEFAGKTRDVDIAKGGTQFCLVKHLDHMRDFVENIQVSSIEELIEKYVEINMLHPFREGNGRATRVWLDNAMDKEFGKAIDWGLISSDDYLQSMMKSPTNDHSIKSLIKGALIDNTRDRVVFFRGLDKSYEYEEMNSFLSDELSSHKNNKTKIKVINKQKR